MNLHRKLVFACALLLSPALAFAHAGHDHSGLMAGIAQPGGERRLERHGGVIGGDGDAHGDRSLFGE